MNISKGKIYNIRRKIERSIKNVQMDARRKHKKIPKLKRESWGVCFTGKWEPIDEKNPVCCPLGAVLIDRQPKPKQKWIPTVKEVKAIMTLFDMTEKQVNDFIDGFDGVSRNRNSEFYVLGCALNQKYV